MDFIVLLLSFKFPFLVTGVWMCILQSFESEACGGWGKSGPSSGEAGDLGEQLGRALSQAPCFCLHSTSAGAALCLGLRGFGIGVMVSGWSASPKVGLSESNQGEHLAGFP